MTLITGTPLGVVNNQDDLYISDAPVVFFQERTSGSAPLNNPDSDGFYWGLTGSSANPVLQLRCVDTVVWNGNVELNMIRCDTDGDTGAIQKLNYLEMTFNLKTMFPLTTLTKILRGGTVTSTSGATEKMGIGPINNNVFYRGWFPTVYDPNTGDYFAVHFHKAQFVDSWSLAFNYGNPSTIGVMFRGFADADLPDAQKFATVLRADPSAIS